MKRSTWEGPDRLRPLSRVGHGQAQALAAALASRPVARVLSSPHLRCRQTVEPLAATHGLAVEVHEGLAEGQDGTRALDLVGDLGDRTTVIASHGDVILALLGELEERGMDLRGPLLCEKGSIWVLEGPSAAPERAWYIPPPARGKTARRIAARGVAPLRVAGSDDEGEETRIGVLDLGSTSFHVLVAEVDPAGTITQVKSDRVMLRLGAAIVRDGVIPGPVFRRAVAAARVLRKVAVKARAERLLAVATAALREAVNGRALAERIGEALDTPVQVLGGEEEARLIFQALRARVPFPEGTVLAVDLGGGSLELAVGDAKALHWEMSLPLGVARLQRELARSDPVAPDEIRALGDRVRELVAPLRDPLARLAPDLCVATGGTVGALAKLLLAREGSKPREAENGLVVTRLQLEALADDLLARTHAERLGMPGMAKRRVDLLPAGARILATLAETAGIEAFTVCDWGLREGVLIDFLSRER